MPGVERLLTLAAACRFELIGAAMKALSILMVFGVTTILTRGLMAWLMEKNKKSLNLSDRPRLSDDQIKALEEAFAEEKAKLNAITGFQF